MQKTAIKVLLIEDNPGDAVFVKQLISEFKKYNCELTVSKYIKDAESVMDNSGFDVIMLDLNLPDSIGLESLDRINLKRGRAPVLVLSGIEDEQIKKLSLKLGAQNFIDKDSLSSPLLERAIMYSIERENSIQEIKNSREILDEIISSSPVMMFIINSDGEMIKANPAADELASGSNHLKTKLAGDVLGCINSFRSGGCGRSAECGSCELRNIISNCMQDGAVTNKKEIEFILHREGVEEKRSIVVSARKIGQKGKEVMLLSIDDRTEERIALREKLESEKKYRMLFTSMGQAFAMHEAIYEGPEKEFNYRFTEINDQFEEMTGLKRSEIIGKTVREVIPGIEGYWMDSYERVARTRQPVQFENYSSQLKRYYSVYAYSPEEGFFATLINDITERKKMEEIVSKQANSIESALKVMEKNPETVKELLDYALEEALSLTESKYGYIYHYDENREEFELNTWSKDVMSECKVAHPQSVYSLERTGIWGEAVRQRKPVIVNDFKAPNPLKKGYPEGHAALTSFMTVPVFSGGRIVAVVGVANKQYDYDETDTAQLELLMNSVWKTVEQKKISSTLKAVEEKWQKFIETVRDIFMIWDSNYNLVAANSAAIREFSILTGNDLKLGIHIKDLLEKAGLPFDENKLAEILGSNEESYKDYYVLKSIEGLSFHYYSDIFRIGDGFGIMMSNITELKRSEAILKQSYEKLQQLDKMKSNFISVASHELRTPLTVIKGFSSFLSKEIAGVMNPKQKEYITTIEQNAERLSRIINDMMDMSKTERGTLTIVKEKNDIHALVRSTVESMKHIAKERGIDLEAYISGSSAAVTDLDRGRINQVIVNLINNAMRFTRSGGKISVSLDLADALELNGWITPDDKNIRRWHRISVTDTGEGIDKKDLSRIFEMFYQVENPDTRKHQGAGLGLSIAKTIIEGHGGRIWAESEGKGKGASFNFIIPYEE